MSLSINIWHNLSKSIKQLTNGDTLVFKKGNKGGPGNPFANKVNVLRKAFYDAVTPEDMARIVSNLKMMAMRQTGVNAIAAARVLLVYTIGNPKDPVIDPENELREKIRKMPRAELLAKVREMIEQEEIEDTITIEGKNEVPVLNASESSRAKLQEHS